jgi:hypothetical protein
MYHEHQSNYAFTVSEHLSRKDYRKIVDAKDSVLKRDLELIAKYGEKVKELRREYLAELHAIIGKKYLPRYLRLHRRRMKQMRSALKKSSPSFEDTVKLEKLRLSNMEKANELIRRSGIDFSRVEALQKKYIRLESKAFSPLVGKEEVNQDVRPRTRGNPSAIVLTPPFESGSANTAGDKSDEPWQPWGRAYADPSGGYLSGESRIGVTAADDSDHSNMLTYATVGSSFVLPWDGALLVRATLETFQIVCSRFQGSVARECGFSQDVEVFEDAKIRFCVFNLTTGRNECKWIRLSKGTTTPPPFEVTYPADYAYGFGDWDRSWFEMGDVVTTNIGPSGVLFRGPYHKDDLLFVGTALYTMNRFWSNDFTVRSNVQHSYRLREVWVLPHM